MQWEHFLTIGFCRGFQRITSWRTYWDRCKEMLEGDVKCWEYVPDIEEVLETIVTGLSEIIFDLFMADKRI